jgi:glycine/D-amino acid oxidase-like deaminating enzyme
MSDVVIVGGGIVGCAAAAFLGESGARVTLVEGSEIGAGASGRNSGAVQHPFDPVLARLHVETLGIYRELDGFALPERPAGLLLLTDDADAAAARLDELQALHRELQPRILAGGDLAGAEPILAPGLTAVRLETGYPVAPDAAVHAFAARAEAAGAVIRVGAAVAETIVGAGRVSGVRLADGADLPADAVLLAAGPWTPSLLDPSGTRSPIVRTWGITVQVELGQTPRHILEEGVVHTVNAAVEGSPDLPAGVPSLFSMVGVGEVSTVGSTFLPFEPDAAAVAPLLLGRGAAIVPGLDRARVLRQRSCARPQSIDGRPMVGAVPAVDGLFVCAGHGPWGISTGPASARMVADLILERPTSIPDELAPARFG